jgi:hypothetical protein
VNITCHHFQARVRQPHQLRQSCASMDREFRVSHYCLFLRFANFLCFVSTIFFSAICFVADRIAIASIYGSNSRNGVHRARNLFLGFIFYSLSSSCHCTALVGLSCTLL